MFFVFYQRARLGSRHQAAVSLIPPIGKNFLTRRQAIMLACANQFAARQPDQNQRRIAGMYRSGDGIRQLWIFRRLVVQHTVRFDMTHNAAFRAGYRRQRADLVQRLGVDGFRR